MPKMQPDKVPATQRGGQPKLGDFAGRIRMSEDFDDWPPDLQGALGMKAPHQQRTLAANPRKPQM